MTNQRETVIDPDREWAVYRCSHGCLHVALNRVTLTLTEEEFHAMHHLMGRTCQSLDRGETLQRPGMRAH